MTHQEAVARYLVAQGVGAFGGDLAWGIHVNVEPPEPDQVITIYASPGDGLDTDELDLVGVGFQVRVRSARLDPVANVYQEAYEKHEAIRNLLVLPPGLVTANATFFTINAVGDIIPLGRDDNDRHLITANYTALRERN